MSEHDVIERRATTEATSADPRTAAYVDFLTAEFPEWDFTIDATETWSGDERTRWVATRDGHHPQAELTAGKLHRRLSDYESRMAARRPGDN